MRHWIFLLEIVMLGSTAWGQYAPPLPMGPEPVADESTPQFVLLSGGRVLQGTLKQQGSECLLDVNGGTIHIPSREIERVAASMREIYEAKAQKVHASDAEGLCGLIRWCLQYDLFEEGEAELARLRQVAPQAPMTEVFTRRLAALRAMHQPKPRQAQVAGAVGTPVEPVGPTGTELEQMARSLPDDAIEMYRRRIQPIFTKNCMESGCHGPDSRTDFKLTRAASTLTRGMLLRNIHTTLRQVNLTNPEASPLLRKPVTPHGDTERVVFANRDYATYQLLIAWTYLVAKNEYVIPRDRMLPTVRPIPVYSPTPHGLERTASTGGATMVAPMVGVHPSLFPASLYPSEYRPAQTAPAYHVVMPQPRGGDVIPASATSEEETSETVLPATGEEWVIRPERRYAPGESTGDVQAVEQGIVPAPMPDMTPQAPAEMLETEEGIQSHEESSGEFYYQPSPDKTPDAASLQQAPASGLLWKQMLEMQKMTAPQ
ncbi:MAG: hypothetical protein Q4D98_13980 [Planctomycetia bacterium]|nr:hypothetical protein [Planctomycetia bacterium]